jgi:hypothetical protein
MQEWECRNAGMGMQECKNDPAAFVQLCILHFVGILH